MRTTFQVSIDVSHDDARLAREMAMQFCDAVNAERMARTVGGFLKSGGDLTSPTIVVVMRGRDCEKTAELEAILSRPLETPAALREFLREEGPLGKVEESPRKELPNTDANKGFYGAVGLYEPIIPLRRS